MAETDKKQKRSTWAVRGRRLRIFFGAWQPVTGGGVASFRNASLGRIFLFQLTVAVVSGLVVIWTVRRTWLPVLAKALAALPDDAAVVDGHLRWPSSEPVRLAENAWLDLVVGPTDPDRAELGQTADLQLVFQSEDLRVSGFAGFANLPYHPDLRVPLGRIEATARWGAWRWLVFLGLGLGVAGSLLVSWWILATLYTLPAAVGAWVAGKPCSWASLWRMATAALLPGALFLDWGLIAYGLGAVRVPGLGAFFGLHWLVGWAWLGWGILNCPAGDAKTPANPFEG